MSFDPCQLTWQVKEFPTRHNSRYPQGRYSNPNQDETPMLSPIYTSENLHGRAYHLRYGWCGWPASAPLSPPDCDLRQRLDCAWQTDGLHRLEEQWSADLVQLTFGATPQVSPVTLAARVKGRLEHALRLSNTPACFSRKLAVRSIGNNVREQVEQYIQKQVEKEPLADPRFRELLKEFTLSQCGVDLSRPTETRSGCYWYNLHLVLVTQGRYRCGKRETLERLRGWSLRIAAKKGYAISALSVMPDHMHMALRGNVEHSPEQIALAFLNNLAYAMGQNALWEFGYYAGTFGEYNMNSVRR